MLRHEWQQQQQPANSTNLGHGCTAVSKAKILASNEMYIKSGSDINLTCVARQAPLPPLFIYWYKNGHLINYSNRGGININTERLSRTSKLVITRATTADSGNYTCAPSDSGKSVSYLYAATFSATCNARAAEDDADYGRSGNDALAVPSLQLDSQKALLNLFALNLTTTNVCGWLPFRFFNSFSPAYFQIQIASLLMWFGARIVPQCNTTPAGRPRGVVGQQV